MGRFRPDSPDAVYLCGGINKLSDQDAMGWREEASFALVARGLKVLDPMRRDYRGKELENVREIIDQDLDDIIQSDFILVNASRPSWGTAMEVKYAYDSKIIVVTWCPEKYPSPWLVGHSTVVVKELDEAIQYILDWPE